jgi:hypothetical protein
MRPSCAGSAGFHITVFELSYQERDCWSGVEHFLLWAAAESASRSNRNSTVNASIDQAAISLGMATFMGACIGFERQWRQRMAGLRTNTLVAIGAASPPKQFGGQLQGKIKLLMPVCFRAPQLLWCAAISDGQLAIAARSPAGLR